MQSTKTHNLIYTVMASFVLLEDFSDDVAYYSLEVTAYYAQDPEKKTNCFKR